MKLFAAAVVAGLNFAPPLFAEEPACGVEILVLGIAQDAGKPQLGHPEDLAWQDPSLARLVASIAVVDTREEHSRRWLFDATPDIKVQLQRLDEAFPTTAYVGLDGIFLTHAHMGHYTGLMHFGHEAARTDKLPVYAMPRMTGFLESNGPWDQLVNHENIAISTMTDQEAVDLAPGVKVTPFVVPHRDEYSETVGFIIEGPERSAIFLPDINGWPAFDEQGTRIESLIADVDIAYLDATFYGDEMPNISAFPHPKILESMDRFDSLDEAEKSKVRFFHLNHSNPALDPDSGENRTISERGYAVATEGERQCLSIGADSKALKSSGR